MKKKPATPKSRPKRPPAASWVSAKSLRIGFLARCRTFCKRTGTGPTVLSVVFCGASSWLPAVERGANMKFESYDRAMRRLDELERLSPEELRAEITKAMEPSAAHGRRIRFLGRCDRFCMGNKITRQKLSVLLGYEPEWLNQVAAARAKTPDIKRANARLDQIISKGLDQFVKESRNGEGKASTKRAGTNGNANGKSDRRKGRSIRAADRGAYGRAGLGARGGNGAMPATR